MLTLGIFIFLLFGQHFSLELPKIVEIRRNPITMIPGYALPNTLVPIHYNLSIVISDFQLREYTGKVDIKLNIKTIVQDIFFNSKDLVIDKNIKLSQPETNELWSPSLLPCYNEICGIRFDEEILPGNYNLEIIFSGSSSNDPAAGLYRTFYKDAYGISFIAVAQFKRSLARTVFPCFDEPHLKASFSLSVIAPLQYHVVSNMHQIMNLRYGTTSTSIFETTPSMSTYLLTFIVSQLEYIESDTHQIRIFGAPLTINLLTNSLRFANQSLNFLENYFNRSYQLPKLDFLSIPDLKMNAMENWGAITFREPLLYWDLDNDFAYSVQTHQAGLRSIVNSLTHMWIGNEVTIDWWGNLWLTEGLAKYFEYLILDKLKPEWLIMDQFVVANLQYAMSLDDESNEISMMSYVQKIDMENVFDSVSYEKSASIFHMFSYLIGPNNFREAIRNLIQNNSYSIITPVRVFEALQYIVDNDSELSNSFPARMKQLFECWSNNHGYPVVNVKRDLKAKLLILSAERFLEFAERNAEINIYIPITLTTEDTLNSTSSTEVLWLMPSNNWSLVLVDVDPETSIMVNQDAIGYYRVNYDHVHWNMLAEQLGSPDFQKISVKTRAQLIDDAAHLAKYEKLPYSIFLDLLSYIKQDNDYIPWLTAVDDIKFLLRMLRGSAIFPKFEAFIRSLTVPVWDKIIKFKNLTDTLYRLQFIEIGSLSCSVQNKACNQAMLNFYKEFRKIKQTEFIEWTEIMYCGIAGSPDSRMVDIIHLEQDFFKLLVDRKIDSDRTRYIINGLGCTRRANFLREYLSWSISKIHCSNKLCTSPELRSEIFLSVFRGSYIGSKLSLEFMLDNYLTIQFYFGSLLKIFEEMSAFIVTDELKNILQRILDQYAGYMNDKIVRAIWRTLEISKRNIGWTERNTVPISDWLMDNVENYTEVVEVTNFSKRLAPSFKIEIFFLLILQLLIVFVKN